MAATKVKRLGFPCKLCGNPRSHNSKANKFKICHKCFMAIRYNMKSNTRYFQTKCEICGKDIDRLGSIPACNFCRSKWYRFKNIRKLVDTAIKINKVSDIRLRITTLYEAGYEITIHPLKKLEAPPIVHE